MGHVRDPVRVQDLCSTFHGGFVVSGTAIGVCIVSRCKVPMDCVKVRCESVQWLMSRLCLGTKIGLKSNLLLLERANVVKTIHGSIGSSSRYLRTIFHNV